MRLFSPPVPNYDGLEKAVGPALIRSPGSMSPVMSSSFFAWVREPFAGAWQKNITPDQPHNILAFSAVYACVTLIADDISKLRPQLVQQTSDGIWVEVDHTSPLDDVLIKPNHCQNWIQFIQQWEASKLLHGNTYVFKVRDSRKVVVSMYVLNPFYVKPMIASDGSVWYQISKDYLAGVADDITLPASEIIHDRCTALWHPLVGVSPIYAAGASATQGMRIQANSKTFFENASRPSGHLSAPGTITDERLLALQATLEQGFSQGKLGRILVTGDGMTFEPMSIPAADAQLIEQLKWTVEDVARAFKVPLYKLGGAVPPGLKVSDLNQDYYNHTLQNPICGLQLCLKEGLELPKNTDYGVLLDLEGLFGMDPVARAETDSKEIQAAILKPNEARKKRNLPPEKGGDVLFLQQQNYSLAALAARDAAGPAPSSSPPATLATPAEPAAAPVKGNVYEGDFWRDVADEYAEAAALIGPLQDWPEQAEAA